MAPNEIGRMFARVDRRDDAAFPGLALALLAGQAPVAVRRTNYFEDCEFIGLFGHHPDHPFKPAQTLDVTWSGLRPYVETFGAFRIEEIARTGQVVSAGQAVLACRASERPFPVLAPCLGRLEWGRGYLDFMRNAYMTVGTKRAVVSPETLPDGVMFSLLHYGASTGVDPYLELAAAKRNLAASELAKREAEAAAQKKREADEQWDWFGSASKAALEIKRSESKLKKLWMLVAAAAFAISLVGWIALTRGRIGLLAGVLAVGGVAGAALSHNIRRIRRDLHSARLRQAFKTPGNPLERFLLKKD